MKPNMAIAAMPAPAASTGTGTCLHCRQVLSEVRTGHARSNDARFCCVGCERVFHYLESEGLTQYYEVLAKLDEAAPSQSIQDAALPGNAASSLPTGLFMHAGRADQFAFFVPALSCAACLWLVQKALSSSQPGLSAVEQVVVNLEDKVILVTTSLGAAPPVAAIIARLGRLGYRALPPKLSQSDAFQTKLTRQRLVDLGISGACFGNVMLFATSVYFGDVWGMSPTLARFFNMLSLVIATVSLAIAGRGFFARAWSAIRERSLHIDLPIAAALGLAFGVSVVNMVRGVGGTYFDSVTGLIFLLLVGRYLSDSLQVRARQLAGSAASLIPASGAELRPGDITTVLAGDLVPADGVVLAGASEVSEAALSGEQSPKLKRLGDQVFAGTHNLVGALRIKVTKSGEDCQVAQIVRLVAEASQRKSPFETAAAAWLPWFVGGTLLAATAALMLWLQIDASRAVEVVCAVLIVSCPCALALATPLTMATALRRTWKHGVIVKSGETLERAAKIDTIVLDKTGTLTTGEVSVVACSGDLIDERTGALLLSIAALSRHPVSRAVAKHLRENGATEPAVGEVAVASCEEIPGRGIVVSGEILAEFGSPRSKVSFKALIGSIAFVAGELANDEERARFDRSLASLAISSAQISATFLELKFPGAPAVRASQALALQDPLHLQTAQHLRLWRARGLDLYIVSGDTERAVAAVAQQCDVPSDHWMHGALPIDKAAFIQRLTAGGRQVMMIGDGVNDAAALSCASVGVAVSGGVDLALSSADVFLGRVGLAPVSELMAFAAHTMTSLRIVLSISVAYNVVAVVAAFAGVLHPFFAAAIMPAASLTVILVGSIRKGDGIWKFSTLSCPLPSPLPAVPS